MNFELLKLVVEQIEKDASHGDYTAIEELLTDIPTEKLKGFFLLLGNGCVCGAPCPLNIYIFLFSFKRI